jgi:hypothetical protein
VFEICISELKFARERRSALCRDVERGHVGKPPYAPYPRRARTPRRRSDHRSLRCDGGSLPVTAVASGPRQVAPIHRPALLVARHWPPERRTSPAMSCPLYACVCHRRDPTSPQPTSRAYLSLSSALPLAHAPRHRAPPSAIDAALVSSSPRPFPWPPEHAQTLSSHPPSLHTHVLA